MSVSGALNKRKSTRAFLSKPVPKEIIEKILDQARLAPSGDNHQPWRVAVLTGKAKSNLCNKLEQAFRSGVEPKMDYEYYPQNKASEKETEWFGSYTDNRKACGVKLYTHLGITKQMTERRNQLYAKNYRAFDAPVMLLFFINRDLGKGSYVDYGIFLQSIMLLAVENGLATCPQGSLSEYGDIVRQELPKHKDDIVLCGMSIGYEDDKNIINGFKQERQDIEELVTYYD